MKVARKTEWAFVVCLLGQSVLSDAVPLLSSHGQGCDQTAVLSLEGRPRSKPINMSNFITTVIGSKMGS